MVACERYKGAVKRFFGEFMFLNTKVSVLKCSSWNGLLLFIKKNRIRLLRILFFR